MLHNGSTTAITTVVVFVHHLLNLVQQLVVVRALNHATCELIFRGLARLDCLNVLLVAEGDGFGGGLRCANVGGGSINNRLSKRASGNQITAAVPYGVI